MAEERSLSDKLSGRFRHPEDAGGKKLLTGRLLRSTEAGSRIAALELPSAPEGVVSLVNRDIPGVGRISFGGTPIQLLCGRKVLWKGQPILVAGGPDPEELDDWMSRINVEYAESDTEPVEQDSSVRRMTRGRPEEAFASAFQVVEDSISVPATKAAGRSRGVICLRDGSIYVVHSATTWPGAIRRCVSRVLKTDRSNVRVRPYPVKPGADSEVWRPAVDACYAAMLSRAARRSVRLEIDAVESRMWDPSTPEAEFHIRGAVDGEGRILAMEINFTISCGSVLPLETEFLDRVIMGIFSIYPCRNYVINGWILRNPESPSAHGPGMGFELGFLAGELFASRVAEHSLVPPGAWRRESLPVPGQAFGPGFSLPRDFPMPDILSKALGISDFERKNASFEQTRLGRPSLAVQPEDYRGIGLSCSWFGNGFVGSPKELGQASVGITLDKEGLLSINVPMHSVSGAMRRAWSLMADEILGIESKSVRFATELAPGSTDPGPSVLGRNAAVYTKLIDLACNELSKKRFRDPLPISVTRSRRRSSRLPWSSEIFEGTPFDTISWGAAVVEVSVSMRTGRIRPTRIWLVLDGGQLLMREHARAAVEASTENALRWCLGEGAEGMSPLIDIQFHQSTTKRPSRDVATLPWLLVPAAFMQAVRQATGIDIRELPVSRGSLGKGGLCR